MHNELIPPSHLAPPSVKHLPLPKRVDLWYELLDEGDAFLIAGLRRRLGPDGDWKAAYRSWYSRRMDEHERMQIGLLENLNRREAQYGG